MNRLGARLCSRSLPAALITNSKAGRLVPQAPSRKSTADACEVEFVDERKVKRVQRAMKPDQAVTTLAEMKNHMDICMSMMDMMEKMHGKGRKKQ